MKNVAAVFGSTRLRRRGGHGCQRHKTSAMYHSAHRGKLADRLAQGDAPGRVPLINPP
jgi:hypothetical protein